MGGGLFLMREVPLYMHMPPPMREECILLSPGSAFLEGVKVCMSRAITFLLTTT